MVEQQGYFHIGARRYRQGIPLSELLSGIVLTKDILWDFLYCKPVPRFEVLAEHDMFCMIDSFFNHAIFYAARGIEQAERARRALTAAR